MVILGGSLPCVYQVKFSRNTPSICCCVLCSPGWFGWWSRRFRGDSEQFKVVDLVGFGVIWGRYEAVVGGSR